jgi:hypothetical protein
LYHPLDKEIYKIYKGHNFKYCQTLIYFSYFKIMQKFGFPYF